MNDNNKPTNESGDQPELSIWDGAEIISVYTRAQALADGVLVDVTTMAKEAGFKFPVAMTHTVWHDFIEPLPLLGLGQSADGRLWDTLYMLHTAIKRAPVGEDVIHFKVIYIMETKQSRLVTLKAVCGPGDNAEPVITVMLPEED
jgi:hypothetical protein